jgi:ArsR family transcriptional regulator, arsenate/arsenite/antimonite-responsive transcriptional repressor
MSLTQLTRTSNKRLIAVFHALSDETRLSIVKRLAGGERCVCDLQDLLDAAQSRLSYHLKTLKDAGIISDRREGRWVHYSLVPGALESVVGFMSEMEAAAQEVQASSGCC